MIKIIVIISCLWFVLICNKRKKESFINPSSFLLGLYLISLLCSIVDVLIGYDKPYILDDSYTVYVFFFLILLLAFLLPYISFCENKIQCFVFPSHKILNLFSTILIILSLAAIIYYIPSIHKVFTYGSLVDARNGRYYDEMSFIGEGPVYTIFSVISSLYVFNLLFFFVYIIIGGHTKRCILLIIASFSETFHILTEVGRDGIVFWFFNFMFFLTLFWNFVDCKKRKLLKKVLFILLLLISLPFALITFSRFSENVFAGISSYLGQQLKHFCYFLSMDNPPISGGRNFPLFWEILGIPKPERQMFINQFTDSGAFGTFMRSLIADIGIKGTLIFCLCMGLIFKISFNGIKIKMQLSSLILYILYFQIFSQGLFYFRQYTRGGNLFIILCIVGMFVLNKRYKNPIILLKKQ